MAGKNSKNQRDLKLKALNEVVVILKKKSVTKNLLTYENVLELTHELYGHEFSSKISPGSIKVPKTKEFKEIKNKIDTFRNEFKKIKNMTSLKSKEEIVSLKITIDNLVQDAVKYYDDKQELERLLENKDRIISKLEQERRDLLEQIYHLKTYNGN